MSHVLVSVAAASVAVMTSAAEFADFARAHLPQPFADQWISLLRPAVVFPGDYGADGSREKGADERPALRGGGEPLLPDDVEWPMFEGRIPMGFITELDCAAMAAVGGVDLMPETGYLLFFCVDYGYEGEDEYDGWPARTTPWTAGKVVYVPEGVERRARRTPAGLEPLEPDHRAALAASTPPDCGHELAERYFGPEAPAMIETRAIQPVRPEAGQGRYLPVVG